MPRLFISHSSKDNVQALAFQRWLMAGGWSKEDVFIDLHGIGAGERWRDTLRKANASCEAVLLLASPDSLDSAECQCEMNLAEDLGKEIIVALLRDLNPADPRLARWADRQFVDLSAEPQERMESIEHDGQLQRVHFHMPALKQDGELIYIIDAWKHDLPTILSKLMTLDDEAIMRIFTFAVAETLPCGNVLVEMLGQSMEVDLGAVHKPDDVFFDLLKDKQAINAALEEVTSKRQAACHISDTAKVQKSVLCNAIKASQPDWTPRYFKFPIGAYTDKGVTGGGVPAFDHWSAIALWLDDSQEKSNAPQAKAA